ncbi:hypothetical protein ONE63_003255 [Megalurothrips usitatus]|uniref:Uncharacterized protein n=1 Tax=Megalurothrips usitatus TaxID=439358 RepID=A0AAV7X7I4_9NEOP|nr:hypothetical protein ONE63_003255 [Megalurothrips usitatus]
MTSQMSRVYCLLSNSGILKRHLASEVQKANNPSAPPARTSGTPQDVVRMTAGRKRMFVLTGIYKSMKDAPDVVSTTTLARNMDKFRVRVSLVIMGACALGALFSISLAKGVVVKLEEERDAKQ